MSVSGAAARQISLPLEQGFGNAAAIAARLLQEMGATIDGVSDSQGAIYPPGGLEASAVRCYDVQGLVVGFPEANRISNADLLEPPCEILVPTALKNQITARMQAASWRGSSARPRTVRPRRGRRDPI